MRRMHAGAHLSHSRACARPSSGSAVATLPMAAAALARTLGMLSARWSSQRRQRSGRCGAEASGYAATSAAVPPAAASRHGHDSSRKHTSSAASSAGTAGSTAGRSTFSHSSAMHAHAASRTAWLFACMHAAWLQGCICAIAAFGSEESIQAYPCM
jgi:hypothetical protein